MSSKVEKTVDLGYAEDSPPWKLESKFFPSKVGGRPAWLDLTNLPVAPVCRICGETCVFLCQVYAPLDEEEECFHRTVFVFLCKNSDCCKSNSNKNFRVFRNQLSRKNAFYSFTPPVESESWEPDFSISKFTKLCDLCGVKADKHCASCKIVNYCSRLHQQLAWKHGHKNVCGIPENSSIRSDANFLLPEFELVIESEDMNDSSQKGEEECDEKKLKEFEKMLKEGKTGTLQGESSTEELEQYAKGETDKQFKKFRERIKYNPEQVLRYCMNGEILWVSSQNIPTTDDIPSCEYCGAKRQFEFQIMPQLLNYLPLDGMKTSIDWGTLVIYTCSASCTGEPVYKEEFLYKQDYTT